VKTPTPKFLILLICILAFSFNVVANESIRFTLTTNTVIIPIDFGIKATNGKQFTVNWGDGSDIETFTGTNQWQEIRHTYSNHGNYAVTITGVPADCLFTEFSISGGGFYWLTNLDVSKSPSLQALACIRNKLDILDLSNNTALSSYLSICYNGLNTLKLNSNSTIEFIQCHDNQLSSLDLSGNTALRWLECNDNQLSSLYVSSNNELNHLKCQNNKLRLSDLYEISLTIKPDPDNEIVFGEQRLASQTIEVGQQVDYSVEKEFFGNATLFTVQKDGVPAPESDYIIIDGIITFKIKGTYQVSMTNSALIGIPKVIAEIEVSNVGISETTHEEMKIVVYPNPTTGELTIKNEQLTINSVEVFDVVGKRLSLHHLISTSSNHHINVSHLKSGIYFIKINTNEGTITKKVIKQ